MTVTGKFNWYELMTTDTKAAQDFYGKVVGWTAEDVTTWVTWVFWFVAIVGAVLLQVHAGTRINTMAAHDTTVTKFTKYGIKKTSWPRERKIAQPLTVQIPNYSTAVPIDR